MAAGKIYAARAPVRTWKAMLGLSALSLAPDLDAVAFVLRIPYGDPWGHRGASHSVAMALVVALVLAGAAKVFHFPVVRTFLTVLVVVASHGFLDALTNGGLGAALLWPFSDARYFAPWHPIPVAPLGLGYLSERGLRVALTELVLFAPLFFYAALPRRKTG